MFDMIKPHLKIMKPCILNFVIRIACEVCVRFYINEFNSN